MNPLHARIPTTAFKRGQWLNLCFDVWGFADSCFKGVTVRSLDLVKVQGACRLRRIFTCLNPLFDDDLEHEPALQQQLERLQQSELRQNSMFEYVPKQVEFPPQAQHFNQFVFPHRITAPAPAQPQQK